MLATETLQLRLYLYFLPRLRKLLALLFFHFASRLQVAFIAD